MITEVTEDYVSFEIAKLLKENGFDEKCHSAWLYNPRKDNSEYFVEYLAKGTENNTELEYFNEPDTDWAYSAPTLQMAMRWLREKGHNIILTMRSKGNDCYVLWTFNIYSNKNYKIIWGELYEQPKYDTYEEAAEAAIKYCLTNLI